MATEIVVLNSRHFNRSGIAAYNNFENKMPTEKALRALFTQGIEICLSRREDSRKWIVRQTEKGEEIIWDERECSLNSLLPKGYVTKQLICQYLFFSTKQ